MKLEQIKEMLSKISPWPWCQDCASSGIRHLIRNCYDSFGCEQTSEKECKRFGKYDGDFIASAPTIIDQLIKQNEVMREALEYYSQDNTRKLYEIWDKHHSLRQEIYFIFDSDTAKKALKEVERIEDEQ